MSLPAARALAKAVIEYKRSNHRGLAFYFVTKKRICELHSQFFQDPTLTDCITFPIDETHGEIFICPRAAILYAREHGGDPHDETALYMIHGILHLLGYDDLNPSKRRAMRKNEKKCMAHVKDMKISLRLFRSR